MGAFISKSTQVKNYSSIDDLKNSNRFSTLSHSQSLLSSFNQKNKHIHFCLFYNKRRRCLKKKVLILGLDGVGKTDLFTRLLRHKKQGLKTDSFSRPTLGYNVETIKLRCSHSCLHQYNKITLWDCGGQPAFRSLWSYHYSKTSLLLWVINVHDRSRLDTNLQLLSQILTNPLLFQVPVLIVLYNSSFDQHKQEKSDEDTNENLLTNLEVAFRFLATLSTSRASTFKWQVVNLTVNDNDSHEDQKHIRQCFRELMEL